MPKNNLKIEINQILNQLSDNTLEELLLVLKNLDPKPIDKREILLEKILKEDKNLLQSLAQG